MGRTSYKMTDEHKRKISQARQRYEAEKRAKDNGSIADIMIEDAKDMAEAKTAVESEIGLKIVDAIKAENKALASVWMLAAAGLK